MRIYLTILSILFFILFPLFISAQTVKIIPKTSNLSTGLVCNLPDSYQEGKSYPIAIFLHGLGGRGNGSQEHLENLVYGALKDGSKPELGRWDPEFIRVLQQNCNKYGIICIAPQTGTDWPISDVENAINWAKENLNIDWTRTMLTGLSLGGGGVLRYITSSKANADKFAVAVPICPVAWGTNYKNVADAGLPVWFFHNDKDGTVSVNNTHNAVAAINAYNPVIPAVKTIRNATGHGGWNEAYSDYLGVIDGSGLTRPKVNIYEWFAMNTTTSPVAVPYDEPPVTPTGLIADGKITLSGSTAKLDGTLSNGYASVKWTTIAVPEGVNIYAVQACGWHTCNVVLPKPGTYTFRVTATASNGAVANKDIAITYETDEPVPIKVVIARLFVNGMEIIVYSDKTAEVR